MLLGLQNFYALANARLSRTNAARLNLYYMQVLSDLAAMQHQVRRYTARRARPPQSLSLLLPVSLGRDGSYSCLPTAYGCRRISYHVLVAR